MTLLALLTAARLAAQIPDCDPTGLERGVSRPSARGTIFRFLHTEEFSGAVAPGPGCIGPAEAFMSRADVEFLLEIATDRDDLLDTLGFLPPWVTSYPDFPALVRASLRGPLFSGVSHEDCIAFQSCSNRGQGWSAVNNVEHEIFHNVQARHLLSVPAVAQLVAEGQVFPTSPSRLGLWASEAQAVFITDRLVAAEDRLSGSQFELWSDLGLSARSDVFVDAAGNAIAFGGPTISLVERQRDAAVFWGYLAEQLGRDQTSPREGIDLVLDFYNRVGLLNTLDALAVVDHLIAERGRTSIHALFHDYATACYTQDLDSVSLASSVSEPDRYILRDALEGSFDAAGVQQILPGVSHLAPVDRDAFCVDGTGCPGHDLSGNSPTDVTLPVYRTFSLASGSGVAELAARYLEFNIENVVDDCRPLLLRARACRDVGWAAIGVTALDEVRFIARGRGRTFSHAHVKDATSDVERLTLVVAGLQDDSSFEVWLDRPADAVDLDILYPLAESPEHVGPSNQDPLPAFLARVKLTGLPAVEPGLVCPAADVSSPEDSLSGPGLRAADFDAILFGPEFHQCDVLAAQHIGGGEYWLTIRPQTIDHDGPHRLLIHLQCGFEASDEARDAVIFGPERVNHMLVLDGSGSMRFPEATPKIRAAQIAAGLYTSAMGLTSRVGLTVFRGDGNDCTVDASTPVSLDFATPGHRERMQDAILAVTPDGLTSIGDGVDLAQDELESFNDDLDRHTMLLLSDGEGNEARYLREDFSGDCERPAALPALEFSDIIANTVAFGPAAEQDLLGEVADRTGGLYSYVDSTASDGGVASLTGALASGNRLADAFLRGLERAERIDRLFATSGALLDGREVEVRVPAGDIAARATRAVFFVNCAHLDAGLQAELVRPDGSTFGGVSLGTASHRVFHLPENEVLEPETWALRLRSSRDTQFFAGLLGRDRGLVDASLRVAQPANGGVGGNVVPYIFEQGVPVTILATLVDARGPVLGARITAEVEKPDGTLGGGPCREITLVDDGSQNDGVADDGVYGAIYTDTFLASPGGTANDDRRGEPPAGVRGSYLVVANVEGANVDGARFDRVLETHFSVRSSQKDLDEDELPDEWELHYRTDPDVDDADSDYDEDTLTNRVELELGTDPWNADTDGGGETDRSELSHGRCPLDRSDDLVGFPQDVAVVTREADEGPPRMRADAITLRFPYRPEWEAMEIWRALGNGSFTRIATLTGTPLLAGFHHDDSVLAGVRYRYRLRAIGDGGAQSRFSGILTARAPGTLAALVGIVTLDGGHPYTDSLEVLLAFNTSPDAVEYRIANRPLTSRDRFERLPAGPVLHQLATPSSFPAERTVYVQFRDRDGRGSDVEIASIIVDPLGDADQDGTPNSRDTDDDGDGLPDDTEVERFASDPFDRDTDDDGLRDDDEAARGTSLLAADSDGDGLSDGDEVLRFRTDPLLRDTDRDGLGDGDEIAIGTDPRDPDSDDDGLLDGEDPDPLGSGSVPFVRADANQSGTFDVSDAITTLLHLFVTRDPRACLDAHDANDDGRVDVSDPTFSLARLFRAGRAIPPPFPRCGEDPSADRLGCDRFRACP